MISRARLQWGPAGIGLTLAIFLMAFLVVPVLKVIFVAFQDPNTGAFTTWPIPATEGILKIQAKSVGYETLTKVVPRTSAQEVVEMDLSLTRAGEAAVGHVRGSLKDARTGQPIGGRVFIPAQDRLIKVGESGEFSLGLTPGRYQVMISSRGYRSQKKDVTIQAGDVVILNLDMHPAR